MVVIWGERLPFTTDSGVFSKDRLDPGTELLLETVPRILRPEDRQVLDLGCGWGAVGIAVARRWPHLSVVGVDINRRAVALAQQNAAQLGLSNYRALEGDGPAAARDVLQGPPDVILTNPPLRAGKEVVLRLLAESRALLRPGGRLAAVIRTRQGAKSYLKALERQFTLATTLERGGGYRVLLAEV